MLIVNSGASVCISPLCLDFVMYKPSTMKIKDLLSSNEVEGEGIIKWNVIDKHGHNVAIDVPGYHIPGADVCLLSPQVLVQCFGGSYLGLLAGIVLLLNNDLELEVKYCPHSRLPFLPLQSTSMQQRSFWTNAFAYTAREDSLYPTLLESSNANLSLSPKEVLL
jgi:hypothetical protein